MVLNSNLPIQNHLFYYIFYFTFRSALKAIIPFYRFLLLNSLSNHTSFAVKVLPLR